MHPDPEAETAERYLQELDARLAKSTAQVERGEVIPGHQILEVLAARRRNPSAK